MNCPNCGTSNLDNATLCIHCGRPLSAASGSYVPPAPAVETTSSYTPPPPPPPPSSGGYVPPPPSSPSSAGVPGGPIPNYLVHSIIVTLCCCLPLGIVAIVFAAQVNSKLAIGDVSGARDASKKAKMFVMIGVGLGLLAWLVWAAFFSAGVMEAIRQGQID